MPNRLSFIAREDGSETHDIIFESVMLGTYRRTTTGNMYMYNMPLLKRHGIAETHELVRFEAQSHWEDYLAKRDLLVA